MIYIMNPGDGLEVETFTDRKPAFVALEKAFAADRNFAKLYRSDGDGFDVYAEGSWRPVDRSNLQIKVLDAARAA